jgi:Ribosomal protein L7/L12 C-terminal domain
MRLPELMSPQEFIGNASAQTLRGNSMAHPLSDQQVQDISAAIYAGRKIEAIKIHRQATGIGLKEAKDFIEALESRLRTESPERFTSPAGAGCSRTATILVAATAAIYLLAKQILG